MATIVVTDVMHNVVLAQRELGDGVFEQEGAYYFDPELVDMTHLVMTPRIYKCPYKGVCHWLDLETDSGTIKDVGWIYTEPREGYEHLRDRVGFAFGMRPGVMVQRT